MFVEALLKFIKEALLAWNNLVPPSYYILRKVIEAEEADNF